MNTAHNIIDKKTPITMAFRRARRLMSENTNGSQNSEPTIKNPAKTMPGVSAIRQTEPF
jgi:hypothetical protein